MKKLESISDVESALVECKEKAVGIQIKISKIQRSQDYKDVEAFNFYKSHLEVALTSIQACLVACESLLETISTNMCVGWVTNPNIPFSDVEADFSKILSSCTSEFKECQRLISLAKNSEFEK